MAIYNTSLTGGIKNNGGTALKAGVPYENNAQAIKTFSNKRSGYFQSVFGSNITAEINAGAINSSVPVPWSSKRPLVKRSTRVIAGQESYNLLTSGTAAPELRSSIHPTNNTRTRLEHTAYKQGKYNFYTGKFDAGYPDNEWVHFGIDTSVVTSRNDISHIIFKNQRSITIAPYQSKTG